MARRALYGLIAATLTLALGATPASAAPGCRSWQMHGTTFWIDQSDKFTVQATPGRLVQQSDTSVIFGTTGSLTATRPSGIFNQSTDSFKGYWASNLQFSRLGYITFRVGWGGADGLQNGEYHGNIHNPRFHEGVLIADLKGYIAGKDSRYNVTWTSRRTPIACRAADVIPDRGPNAQAPITLKFPEPPPPKREISSQGRARPSSGADTGLSLWAMPYESESDLGGKFDLSFRLAGREGERFRVTGTITNTDIGPQYNGTFDGWMVMSNLRRMNMTYSQPGAGGRGTVVFVFSEDGETFRGEGMHMGRQPFVWTGRRKRGPN